MSTNSSIVSTAAGSFRFRRATIADVEPLRHLARHTFVESYCCTQNHSRLTESASVREAQLKYIEDAFTAESVAKELADEKNIFVVVERLLSNHGATTEGGGGGAIESSVDFTLTVDPSVPSVLGKEEGGGGDGAPAEAFAGVVAALGPSHFVAFAKLVLGAVEDELDMGPNPLAPSPTNIAEEGAVVATDCGRRPIRLQRMYVATSYIGRAGLGMGSLVMEECLKIARAHRCDLMWLGAAMWNVDAIRFYQQRHGFRRVGLLYFVMGDSKRPNDLLQRDLWWSEYSE